MDSNIEEFQRLLHRYIAHHDADVDFDIDDTLKELSKNTEPMGDETLKLVNQLDDRINLVKSGDTYADGVAVFRKRIRKNVYLPDEEYDNEIVKCPECGSEEKVTRHLEDHTGDKFVYHQCSDNTRWHGWWYEILPDGKQKSGRYKGYPVVWQENYLLQQAIDYKCGKCKHEWIIDENRDRYGLWGHIPHF